jgi:hypothetical protein
MTHIRIFFLDHNIYNMQTALIEGFTQAHSGFPSGYFKIRSRMNGRCLDVNGGSTNNGSRVVLFNCHDGLHQHWYVDSYGRIINRLSNKALVVKDNNKSNGAPAVIDDIGLSKGESGTRWIVDTVGRIKSKLNKKNLTFDGNAQSEMLPTYLWEDYNGPSQKWYFERLSQPKQTVELIRSQKGYTKISADKIPASDELTIQFWLKLNKFVKGSWKVIYRKGPLSPSFPRSPGLWIYPNMPRFHVRMSTTKNKNEGCDPNYAIPIKQWVNITHIVRGKKVEFYINGKLIRKCKLTGYPNPNSHPMHILKDNDHSEIRFMEYSNYALNKEQIEHNMKLKKPEFGLGIAPKKPIKTSIKIVNMTSNGSLKNKECDPFRGQLNQPSAWCASKKESMKFYLQATFDQMYYVRKIFTQGRSTSEQWTSRYSVEYQDPVTDKWIRFGSTFTGNKDKNSIKINKVKFMTKSVRIYPVRWNKWPSLRVGFDGGTSGLSRCETLLKKSQDAKTTHEKKEALIKYNKDCRNISFDKHLKILKEQKEKYDQLYQLVHKYKGLSGQNSEVKQDLKKKLKSMKKNIKDLELEVELAKARKCPPNKKCLAILSAPKLKIKKANVNDFDIRTHQDFHKYVEARKVQSCSGSKDLSKGSSSKPSASKDIKTELSKCQSNFLEAFSYSNFNRFNN